MSCLCYNHLRDNNYNYYSLKKMSFKDLGYKGKPICEEWFRLWVTAGTIRVIGPLFVLIINMGVPVAIN